MNNKIMEQMPKAFESNTKEKEISEIWTQSGLFNPDNMEQYLREKGLDIKSPFTITLPPPNANGDLHLGHMCGYSFQDVMGRYARMTGHSTLLLPGKDHAGIQTESVFTKKLKAEGVDKWELGREEFYKRCYEFCMNNANNARTQEKSIGLSADFSREKFTLDPKLTAVVYDTFHRLFDDKLVYRGKRIINQCPNCKTALADIDTEYEELRGIFAYIVYPFVTEEDKKKAKEKFGVEGITVATTRPETMLGDTAVAVHPDDERYKEFVGHKVLLPIANREIPIITDEGLDIETGTGALKVTPAHSPIDYKIAQANNLPIMNVINEEGLMTGDIPERFKGMDTISCSKALVKELSDLGLLIKIENIKHSVQICERCKTPIQPIISAQWYLNVDDLAKKAKDEILKGNTTVIPEGQQRALEHFFDTIEPWCISRQLWWGQRIPIWYSGGKELYDWTLENTDKDINEFTKETVKEIKGSGKAYFGDEKPELTSEEAELEKDNSLEPETDMFDTWFSSGQWTFSTLGGVDGEDFKKYFPTQVMETARDILFWWVARMMMLGIYRTGKTPFSKVFLHGLIQASDGTKMSKSKGNVVLPAPIIEKYGADSLRLWYYTSALPGSNPPIDEDKIKGNRFFINKIWNASRFVLMNIEESEFDAVAQNLTKKNLDADNVRIRATKEHINKIFNYMDNYQFHLGAEEVREFFWHIYCDKWIEEVKEEIKNEEIGSEKRISLLSDLVFILKENLKIMHPFIPFITESMWQELVKAGLAEGILAAQQVSK